MSKIQSIREGLTFDDVLLVPNASDIHPADADVRTRVTRAISLNIPLLSAAMDTVTDSGMAIAMALAGGLGVIHRNMDAGAQGAEVARVKNFRSNAPDRFPLAATDGQGNLLAGAAVGTGQNALDRIPLLAQAGLDVLIIDTAHGHSQNVLETVWRVREAYPNLQIVAGNIATAAAAKALIDAGADGLKVGIGPGSICTTRIVAGVGVPQLTAIMDVYSEAAKHDIPVIADGGIKFSGDFAKAIAAGADCAMIGGLLAGCDEAPGETIMHDGRAWKAYRGMGSVGAMVQGSADRYGQGQEKNAQKLVPEGIEGRVLSKGPAADVLHQMVGGLRAAMGYTGCRTIPSLKTNAEFTRMTGAGFRESHVHDVTITQEAPNYRQAK